MNRLKLSENRRGFLHDGKPHFLLADTIWSAFACATPAEWDHYTRVRSEQGFNAVQISLLPVLHDASDTYIGEPPYRSAGGFDSGPWDFTAPNTAFFDRAEQMLELAVERGLRPCIVLLWNNYVAGTWANARRPDVTIARDEVGDLARYAAARFRAYSPIYYISGDTKFENDEITGTFLEALDVVKEEDPETLASMHIGGNMSDLPDAVVSSKNLDFYTYQSGHRITDVHASWQLAEAFREKSPVRPIVNSEPCYEGHGHAGSVYGRFNAFDVRRAFWQSVLAGANAGFTYGGHGLWSWHRRGAEFTSVANSRVPIDWTTSLRLPGGSDTAASTRLFEALGLHAAEPAQELLVDAPEAVRCARVRRAGGRDDLVIYMPYTDPVTVRIDSSPGDAEIVDLASRTPLKGEIVGGAGGVTVAAPEINSDYIVVLRDARI